MSVLGTLYTSKIKEGKMTLKDVPSGLLDEVKDNLRENNKK